MGAVLGAQTSAPPTGPVLYIEWTANKSAQGYLVQIKNPQGKVVLEKNAKTNRLDFQLPPGQYAQRVGILNKFRKVARWGAWKPFLIRVALTPRIQSMDPPEISREETEQTITISGQNFFPNTKIRIVTKDGEVTLKSVNFVDGNTMTVVLDPSQIKPGSYDVVLENPGGKQEKTEQSLAFHDPAPPPLPAVQQAVFTWKVPIPGIPQFGRSENYEGALWLGLFAAFGAAGFSEWETAEALAESTRNNPVHKVFNDPIYYFGAQSTLLNQPDLLYASLYTLSQLEENEASYAIHQQNQSLLGGLALSSYFYYIYRESSIHWQWKALLPGAAQLQRGETGKSLAWMGGFTALAALGTLEWQAANAAVTEMESNPLNQLFNDPLLVSYFQDTLFRRPELLAVGAYALQQKEALEADYVAHEKNQTTLGMAALFLYMAQVIDATFESQTFPADTANNDGPNPQWSVVAAPQTMQEGDQGISMVLSIRY